MRRKWTDDEVNELTNMINRGMSNREIVNYYGFDNTASEGAKRFTDKLQELRSELGIKSYNPYIDMNNKIKQLVENGYSNKEILKEFGLEKYCDKGASTITHNAANYRRTLSLIK